MNLILPYFVFNIMCTNVTKNTHFIKLVEINNYNLKIRIDKFLYKMGRKYIFIVSQKALSLHKFNSNAKY